MSETTAGAQSQDLLTHDDFLWAFVIALIASVLLSVIQIPAQSKTSLRSCFVTQSLVYCVILCFGNVVTTILASLAVTKLSPSLKPYYYLLAPFFGVFGFETILKNTNITMFDKGVLTIQDWIGRALNAAAGAAIEKEEDMRKDAENQIFAKLINNTEEQVNTLILNKLGAGVVEKLEAAARASGANSKQYKVLQYISALGRSEVASYLRSK